MANALFVDALKGYEYYLSQRGKVDLDQINDYLLQNDRNPIAQRTYIHYQKLLQNGFRSYIPINKFDVFQAIGKIQIAADRRRYSREIVEIPCRFSKDGSKWVESTIIDRSIVGFGILTHDKYPTRTGVTGWVRLTGFYDIPVVIVWRKHEEDRTRIGVRAMEFIAKFRVHAEDLFQRPVKVLRVHHKSVNALDWDNLFSVFSRINEMIYSAADLIYSLEDIYDVQVRLSKAVLKSIEFNSPGETSIKIDFGIGDILRLIIEKIQFWGLQKRKLRAEVEGQELDNEAVALANANLKVEILRNAVKLGGEIQDTPLRDEMVLGLKEIIPSLLGTGKSSRGAFAPESPELAILTERLIPAAVDLIAGDDADYTVEVEDD